MPLMLDYSCEKHSEKYIIEDLQETIRLFSEIIAKLKVSIAEDFADKIFGDTEEPHSLVQRLAKFINDGLCSFSIDYFLDEEVEEIISEALEEANLILKENKEKL